MLMTYFIVGCAFAIPELVIVTKYERLRAWLQRNTIIELIFSLGVGVAVGVFTSIAGSPVGGVTIVVGNVMATVITKTIYSLHLIDHARAFKRACKDFFVSVKMWAVQFADLVRLFIKILSMPFKAINQLLKLLNKLSSLAQQ